MVLIRVSLCPAEPSGPAVCGDCNTEMDSYSKEQAFCPQPVSRDSTQPGTLSSQEPSRSEREHSPHQLNSGTIDGSHTNCRGSLYPSNHDRMLTSLKKKPGAPLDGQGNFSLSPESPAEGGDGGRT